MKIISAGKILLLVACCNLSTGITTVAAEGTNSPAAKVNLLGGPGWAQLGEKDFKAVNCNPETWTWKDGQAHCNGKPSGVISTMNIYTNFEMSVEWKHETFGGNSGVIVWCSP